jgi:glycosyltransferase involved in cell wall biosynthesis
MSKPILSVIIPVYNVERYLRECVDSITSQGVSAMEIILVDDGSTDTSGEICDAYAEKFEFVSAIHKPNGGLSDARNVGLAEAIGTWILFVDSDDYIAENALPAILSQVTAGGVVGDSESDSESDTKSDTEGDTVDLVFLNNSKVFPDGRLEDLGEGLLGDQIRGKCKADFLDYLGRGPKFPGSACAKLIRREIVVQNDLQFERNLLSEDVDFMLSLMLHCERFDAIDVPYYRYRQNREGSITNTLGAKNLKSLLYILEKWTAQAEHTFADYKTQILTILSYEYAVLLGDIGLVEFSEADEKTAIWQRAKALRYLLGFAASRKVKLVARLSKIVGLTRAARILTFYLRSRS